eukprot:CAMPEP_0172615846 /NCGR_PEP_ID=MMETSP1068-20121228/62540_1 /TAXON_ID=35684 /ORGANISM="Pseudopedinella elastica, Strain CCMP716" /LENGTH=537 /DNA_ID=CAMNT_0013421115 /DNA_START=103 /DNA_END=1716 /DNA_ORIENTATION=-
MPAKMRSHTRKGKWVMTLLSFHASRAAAFTSPSMRRSASSAYSGSGAMTPPASPTAVHTVLTATDVAAASPPATPSASNKGGAASSEDRVYSEHVEPFELVRGDLKDLKLHIKELVQTHVGGGKDKTREGSTNPLLQEAAREFFERRERAWRPGTVLLMARALGVSAPEHDEHASPEASSAVSDSGSSVRPNPKQLQLAEIVEMMVTAQVIHDDVLEEYDLTERGNAAHRMYSSSLGNKVSLLAGDFLLARSSVALAQLTNTEVVGIIGKALEDMCRGEIMQAQAKPSDKLDLDYYTQQSTLKVASLLADACRCTAILRGEESDSPRAEAAWRFGHHLALAYSLGADTLAYTTLLDSLHTPQHGAATALAKLAEGDLSERSVDLAAKELLVSAKLSGQKEATKAWLTPQEQLVALSALPPFALAAKSAEGSKLAELAERVFAEESDVQEALSLLEAAGPEVTCQALDLARGHKALAEAAALELPHSPYRDGLLVLAEYVVQEDQRGLQRAKWQELQREKNEKRSKELLKKAKASGLI